MARRPRVVIVSPALAQANNGNWQTAWRWARLLAGHYRCCIVSHWQPQAQADPLTEPQALLVLHARRSADSAAAWAQAHPGRGLAVVLTGTDLYRDIQTDASAQRSLALAQRLVVLQPLGVQALPAALHDKTRVILQSTTSRRTLDKTARHLRVVMVGHLREEKSPQTLMQAARLLRDRPDIRIDHIGAALDPALGRLARQTMADCPNYRWLGGLTHAATRGHIQRAHVLVHCSQLEGGAHVLMEAVCSGTPVLASQVPGNVGMLGADYAGYFPWGDAQALVEALLRLREPSGMLAQLQAQCRLRAPLFAPSAERAALLSLLTDLIPRP